MKRLIKLTVSNALLSNVDSVFTQKNG